MSHSSEAWLVHYKMFMALRSLPQASIPIYQPQSTHKDTRENKGGEVCALIPRGDTSNKQVNILDAVVNTFWWLKTETKKLQEILAEWRGEVASLYWVVREASLIPCHLGRELKEVMNDMPCRTLFPRISYKGKLPGTAGWAGPPALLPWPMHYPLQLVGNMGVLLKFHQWWHAPFPLVQSRHSTQRASHCTLSLVKTGTIQHINNRTLSLGRASHSQG